MTDNKDTCYAFNVDDVFNGPSKGAMVWPDGTVTVPHELSDFDYDDYREATGYRHSPVNVRWMDCDRTMTVDSVSDDGDLFLSPTDGFTSYDIGDVMRYGKVVDYESHGNVVRLLFGWDGLRKWYGDDWNDYGSDDSPVYERFTCGWMDVAWSGDWDVWYPAGSSDSYRDSNVTKEDLVRRHVPILQLFEHDPYDYHDYNGRTVDIDHAVMMGDRVPELIIRFRSTGGCVLGSGISPQR